MDNIDTDESVFSDNNSSCLGKIFKKRYKCVEELGWDSFGAKFLVIDEYGETNKK